MDPRTTFMATFETELGRCVARWSDAGITGVLLPNDGRAAWACLRRRHRRSRLRATRDRGDGGCDGRRVAGSSLDPARRAWHRRLPAGRLQGDARDPGRHHPKLRRGCPGDRPAATALGTSERRWPATRSRSSFRATASSRRTGHSPGSRHRAACRRSAGCSSSRARRATASRSSSANAREGAGWHLPRKVATPGNPET